MKNRGKCLERAAALLARPDCRALAVELSVLLPLPLWEETDLYALMEPDARRILRLNAPLDFPGLRLQARGARLAEVYGDLSDRVVHGDVRELAEVERQYRMRLPQLMGDVLTLMRRARKAGKHVILYAAGEAMLTNAEVAQMLLDRGVEAPDELCIDHWGTQVITEGTLLLSPVRERQAWRSVVVPSPVEGPLPVDGLIGRNVPGEGMNFLGFRTMRAVTAFGEWDAAGAALGMYLLSNAMWLVDEACRAGLDRVCFLARDGYLVQQVFDRLCAALHLPVESAYVRISRRAVFPLHFRTERDLLLLPTLTDLHAHTPRTLLELFAPVVDMPSAVRLLQELGFHPDELLDEAEAAHFIEVFRVSLFDEGRFAAYRAHAEAYFRPLFTGRCATWDVGYNLRAESVLQELTGAELTAFITHADSDLAQRRRLDFRTLYPASPWVSWVAREQFLIEDAPPCIAYGPKGPVLGAHEPMDPAIAACQAAAMRYVDAMLRIFGPDVERLPFRPADGCMPFEALLHAGHPKLLAAFRDVTVENGFLEGGRAGDSPNLQWRLMQTDGRAALRGHPRWLHRLTRFCLRLRHAPASLLEKLNP